MQNIINDYPLPIIRQARQVDAKEVISGINAICAEEEVFFTTRFIPTPQWEAVLYLPEETFDHQLVVAELDGKIVGVGRLFSGGRNTRFSHVAELGIFVLRPFRRQGIGTRLLARLMDWATQSGLEKIVLTVFATNQPAILFFEKQGFFQEGRMCRQIKIEEQYIDLLSMGKFLSSNDES